MSGQKITKKPKYEAPAIVPLGKLAQGTGYCAAGSSASLGYCTAGNTAEAACTGGSLAGAACTSFGVSPISACTGGGSLHT